MKSEEIAKIEGASRSTVPRAINNFSNVPAETREKVLKVIREYNYEPNNSARVLAGKGKNTIGLFLISLSDKGNTNKIYSNSYFAPFMDAVVESISECEFPLAVIDYEAEDLIKLRDGSPKMSLVNACEYDSIKESLEYLVSLGHREIGIITGRQSTYSGKQRLEAFMH